MVRVGGFVFDQFDDAGTVAHGPGDDLTGVGKAVGLDNGPAAMNSIGAAPIEVMQISGSGEILDNLVAILSVMRGFNQVAVHSNLHSMLSKTEKWDNEYRV